MLASIGYLIHLTVTTISFYSTYNQPQHSPSQLISSPLFHLQFKQTTAIIYFINHILAMSQIITNKKATPSTPNRLERSAQFHASDIAAPPPTDKSEIKSIRPSINRNTFLRGKPQLLVVMQQAQIERLGEYLNEYKGKYNQLHRQKLDRLSYQTQIKQLFERQSDGNGQLEKLNSTIEALLNRNESYRQQLFAATQEKQQLAHLKAQLEKNNAELLRQIETITENRLKERTRSQQEKHILGSQVLSLKTYIESLELNNVALVKSTKHSEEQLQKFYELQARYNHSSQYIKTLNKEIEVKSSNYLNQSKDHSELLKSFNGIHQSHAKSSSQIIQLNELIKKLQSQNKELLREKQQGQAQSQNALLSHQHHKMLLESQIFDIQTMRGLKEGELKEKQAELQEIKQKYNANLQKLRRLHLDIAKESQQKTQIQRQRLGLQRAVENLQERLGQSLTQNALMKTQVSSKTGQYQKAKSELQLLLAGEVRLSEEKDRREKQLMNLSKIMSTKVKQNESLKMKLISQEEELIERFQQNLKHFTEKYDAKLNTITADQEALDQQNKKLQQQKERLKLLLNTLAKDHSESKKQMDLIQAQKTELQKQKAQLLLSRTSEEQAKKELQSQVQMSLIRISQLNKEKQYLLPLTAQKVALERKLEQLQANNQSSRKNVQNLQTALAHSELKIEESLRQKLQLQKTIGRVLTQNISFRKDQEALQKQTGQSSQMIALLKGQNSELHKNIGALSLQKNNDKIAKQQMKGQIVEKTNQIANIRKALQKLEENEGTSIIKIKELQTKVTQSTVSRNNALSDNEQMKENKKALIQERSSLTNLLQSKTKEAEKLKIKLIDLQSQLRASYDLYLKEQEAKYTQKINAKDQQKAQLSTTLASLSQQSIRIKQSQEDKHQQLIASIAGMTADTKKDKSFIQYLQQEHQLLKLSFNTLNERLRTAQNDLQKQSKESEQQRQSILKISQQKSQNIEDLKALTVYYENRIDLLLKEIQRLQQLILKNNIQSKGQIESIKQGYTELSQNNSIKKAEIEAKRLKIIELEERYRLVSTKTTYYEDMISKLRQEFLSLQLSTAQLQKQRDSFASKNSQLVRSIKKMSEQVLLVEGEKQRSSQERQESSVNEELKRHYSKIQNILNSAQRSRTQVTHHLTIQNNKIVSQ